MMQFESFEAFCADPQLIGEPISKPWAVFYKAVEGLSLDADELELFFFCTGRSEYAPHVYTEATAICGRRSEKTSTAVKFALWKSLFGGFESRVRPGELLRVPIVCQDLRIAKDVLRTVRTFLRNSPVLINEIDEDLATEIRLRNGLSFTSYPCTVSAPRGLSCPIAICDELAFWQIETGANPDLEILRALRPAMILFGQARRLLKISTPWQRAGVLFDEYSQRGEKKDLLVWQASTERMSPRVSRADLEKERAADSTYFSREFEAIFTEDTEAFLPSRDIDLAIRSGVREVPFSPALAGGYFAAIDASGLSGKDRFTFAIGHRAARGNASEGIAFDMLRGWQRQAVGLVCEEIAALLKTYGLRSVTADQFGFSFLRELLSQRGIEVIQLPFTARSKPEIFLDLKLALSQGRIQLLDHPESLRELRMLESKRTSGGNYSISAPRGQHDDYATVIALLAHRSKSESASILAYLSVNGHTIDFSRNSRGETVRPTKPQAIAPNDARFWKRSGRP